MKTKKVKQQQLNRLEEICQENDISFTSIQSLLNSVKTKKLYKRNNYHLQKINDEIEKSLK